MLSSSTFGIRWLEWKKIIQYIMQEENGKEYESNYQFSSLPRSSCFIICMHERIENWFRQKKREPFPSHANKLETFVTHLCFNIFIIISHCWCFFLFMLCEKFLFLLIPFSFVAVISITYHSFLKGMIWRWWYKYTEGKGKGSIDIMHV